MNSDDVRRVMKKMTWIEHPTSNSAGVNVPDKEIEEDSIRHEACREKNATFDDVKIKKADDASLNETEKEEDERGG